MTGTIARLQADRGFGFLRGSDGTDYFFHRSAVASDVRFEALAEGDAVEFDVEPSVKGPRAGVVRLPAAS